MTDVDGGRGRKTATVLYRVMLALWVGGIAMYTFLVTPVLFRYFGRDTASATVDRLFPFYFPYTLVVPVLAFGFFLASGLKQEERRGLPRVLLIGAVLIGLFVNFGIYPEAKRAKREIASFEKETADSPARARFRTLHGISMALNLILLADGVALIVIDSLRGKKEK
jgi:hypothetical protein